MGAEELKRIVVDLLGIGNRLSMQDIDALVADVMQKADRDGNGSMGEAEFLYFYRKCLSSSKRRQAYTEKLLERYAATNPRSAFLSGF